MGRAPARRPCRPQRRLGRLCPWVRPGRKARRPLECAYFAERRLLLGDVPHAHSRHFPDPIHRLGHVLPLAKLDGTGKIIFAILRVAPRCLDLHRPRFPVQRPHCPGHTGGFPPRFGHRAPRESSWDLFHGTPGRLCPVPRRGRSVVFNRFPKGSSLGALYDFRAGRRAFPRHHY